MKNLVALLAIVFLIGCTSQQKTLYNTLASVQSVTTGSYNGYLDLVVKGKITTNSVPKISRDYDMFQQIWTGAVILAQWQTNSIAPPQVVTASSNLVYEISVAK